MLYAAKKRGNRYGKRQRREMTEQCSSVKNATVRTFNGEFPVGSSSCLFKAGLKVGGGKMRNPPKKGKRGKKKNLTAW
ncbi:hypothetical protein EYF80_012438 [Liparis tanakae]|uniref:Uncharacterized protein n=1 Tax=Liparis tanakae TaxID=230148 RepID=A0A4Z2IIR6_9TELE|nr:hypothetical protein EYF80_012438 [Liparis tanakae]